MRPSRIVALVPLLLGLAGCASSIRVGGGGSEEAEWEYRVLPIGELAGMDAQELYSNALERMVDSEQAARQCEAVEKGLNQLAGEGWVLIGMDLGTFVFRRPRED